MCCCSGSASSTEAFVTKLQIAFLAQPSLASAWFYDSKILLNLNIMQIVDVFFYIARKKQEKYFNVKLTHAFQQLIP